MRRTRPSRRASAARSPSVRLAGALFLVATVAGGCADVPLPSSSSPVPYIPPQVSADGRFVAYVSDAADPDPTDTDQVADVFVRDRALGTTTRITEPGFQVGLGGVSADGRYVAYHSTQDVADAAPADADVYVWDRTTGTSRKISSFAHASAEAISGDGRFVVLLSTAPDGDPAHQNPSGMVDVYVWDRATEDLSRANDHFTEPDWVVGGGDVSDDGRFVVWQATRVSDDPIPNDIYLRDRTEPTHRNITLAGLDSFDPSISADGATVVFTTGASLVPGDPGAGIVAWDRASGGFRRVTRWQTPLGDRPGPASANGRYVAFTRADSPFPAITGPTFVADLHTGYVVPVAGGEHEVAGQVSDDGRVIVRSRYPAADPPLHSGDVRSWVSVVP